MQCPMRAAAASIPSPGTFVQPSKDQRIHHDDLQHRSGLQPPTTARCQANEGSQAAAACPSGCTSTMQASTAGSSGSTARG